MGGSGPNPNRWGDQPHHASARSASVLDATAVEPYQAGQAAANLVPLQDLMKNTAFKSGQRYTDYQKGEKFPILAWPGSLPARMIPQMRKKMTLPLREKARGFGDGIPGRRCCRGGVLLFLGAVQQRRKPRHVRSGSPVDNGTSNENEPAHEPAAVLSRCRPWWRIRY